MNTTNSLTLQTVKSSKPIFKSFTKGAGKVATKVGGKVLMPLGVALDTYDTVKNPKFEGGWDYLNPIKMTYTAAHKIPVVKNIVNKSDKFFENIGSKIHDATNNEPKEVNKIVANKDEKNEMQKDNKLSNNAKVLGAIGLTGASILAYKLYKRHKEKNKNMKKGFNEYNTLAGKMHNFNIITSTVKGLYQLGKNTLKAGVKNRYTKSGVKKTSMVGADGKPIYDIKPDTLNMANIGKDAAITGGAGLAGVGLYEGSKYIKNKVSEAADTASDYKDALIHNKETKNPDINKSAAGLKLAGAGVVGAMAGGLSGAVLTPLGGYLGRSYGPAGELLGGAAGLVGGAVMNKYLKRLKERQKELKLQNK